MEDSYEVHPGAGLCARRAACYALAVPSDAVDRDLFRRIQDQVAVVGIAHLPFAKDIGRPISDTAVEAIQLALDDAGLEAEDLDGMSMLEMEATHEVSIARRLGVRQITWWDKISYGGGASSATLMHAAAAVASGLATVVACHRARNRGAKTSRPWSQEKVLVRDDKALHTPWGLIRPVDVIGMWAHRHMHQFGTTREHFGNVAVAARKHAQKNPFAMMRGRPLDMETYLAGRVIGYPLTLFEDRKSTRLNSSHLGISYAVFCLKKKNYGTVSTHLQRRTTQCRSRRR